MLAPVVIRPDELLAAVPVAQAVTLAVRLRRLRHRTLNALEDGIATVASLPVAAGSLQPVGDRR